MFGDAVSRRVSSVCFILGSLLLAQTSVHATTQLGSVTVIGASIYMGNVGGGATGAYIDITPALAAGTEGCTGYGGAWNVIWIDFSAATAPDGKALYATLLSAYLAGKRLTFGLSGCGMNGQIPQIYRVDISD